MKWYVPYFPVVRPDRATTKIRIVASARYKGFSLNTSFIKDQNFREMSYSDVLLRLRRYPVALICDNAEMYLRIEVAPRNRSCQWFLWGSLDQRKERDEYNFSQVVYRVNSSPIQAQSCPKTHAQKHEIDLPMTAETVLKSTYMDENIHVDSVADDDQGVTLYRQFSLS